MPVKNNAVTNEMAPIDRPDHRQIIAAIATLTERVDNIRDEFRRRLESQDRDLEILKAANNVAIGKGLAAKLGLTTLAGGLGAGILKLVDWLNHSGPSVPPGISHGGD